MFTVVFDSIDDEDKRCGVYTIKNDYMSFTFSDESLASLKFDPFYFCGTPANGPVAAMELVELPSGKFKTNIYFDGNSFTTTFSLSEEERDSLYDAFTQAKLINERLGK